MTGERQGRARRGLGLMPGAGPRGALLLAGAALVHGTAFGQSYPVVSRPVVQPLPSEGAAATSNDPARRLSNALGRVGRNPRDADALADAGNAAMAMGDESAAAGFYARAEQIAPGNPRVAASWAAAKLHGDDPMGAIPLYDQAALAGPLTSEQQSDRGLAHDLVGDNANAQRFYREALASGANDEAQRRLALSQAIGGDRKAMETTLAPLLQKQDRAAWRTRAFAFAILGREDEAVAIARSTMPTELANGMAPFLRFMRKLTPAQQAAAANLGRFPRAADIGKDDPRVVAYVAQHGIKRLAAVDEQLTPAGAPLGAAAPARRDDSKAARKRADLAKADLAKAGLARAEPAHTPPAASSSTASAPSASNPLPPEPNPSREVSQPPALASSTPLPPPRRVAVVEPAPQPAPQPSLQSVAPPATRIPSPAAQPSPAQGPGFPALGGEKPQPARNFDLARLPAGETAVAARTGPEPEGARTPSLPPEPQTQSARPAPPVPAPTPRPAPSKAPARKANFAEAFSAWAAPEKAAVSEAPAAGAVDMRKITPRRPPPKAPPPPAYPSRVWVQVGVGRNDARIAYDWHKLSRENPKLLGGRKAYTSDWGRTNRVLVGPFDDEDEAKAFVAKAKKGGMDDAFVWLSPEGQAVDPLAG